MSFFSLRGNKIKNDELNIRQMQSSTTPTKKLQYRLKWGVPRGFTSRLCNQKVDISKNKIMSFFGGTDNNKRLSEPSSFFTKTTFIKKESARMMQNTIGSSSPKEMTFYDSRTGIPLFTMKRRWSEFIDESKNNGYLTFHEEDVIDGSIMVTAFSNDVFSKKGKTYLGQRHKVTTKQVKTGAKDEDGDDSYDVRYVINIASIAGYPTHYNNNIFLDTTTNDLSWKEQISFSERNNNRSNHDNDDDDSSHMTFRDDDDSFDSFSDSI